MGPRLAGPRSSGASALRSLATDLEDTDAPPTVPQRDLLDLSRRRLDGVERRLARHRDVGSGHEVDGPDFPGYLDVATVSRFS